MSLGKHVLAELSFCDPEIIDDEQRLRMLCVWGAQDSGARVLNVHSQKFHPQGVTVTIALAESHLALHTWPELGLVTLDVFTCGEKVDPLKAVKFISNGVDARAEMITEIKRGHRVSPGAYCSELVV